MRGTHQLRGMGRSFPWHPNFSSVAMIKRLIKSYLRKKESVSSNPRSQSIISGTQEAGHTTSIVKSQEAGHILADCSCSACFLHSYPVQDPAMKQCCLHSEWIFPPLLTRPSLTDMPTSQPTLDNSSLKLSSHENLGCSKM